jgi:hypothetical protein
MKLFKITMIEPLPGYDVWEGAVVCAENRHQAKKIHPSEIGVWGQDTRSWAKTPTEVHAEYIGEARPEMPEGVVLSSFLAG